MKQLLKLKDLSKKEIQEILNLADQLKYEKKNGIEHPILKGKTVGLLYNQPSARSHLSFSASIGDLGGTLIELNVQDIESWKSEPIEDTVRFLCRYLDCMVLRDFPQKDEETMADLSTVPVVNAFSQGCHPLQGLAALMTIREKKGVFQNRKLAIIGGGGPIPSSLIWGGLKMGMEVCLCCPKELKPEEEDFTYCENPREAVHNADVVYVCPYAEGTIYTEKLKPYQVTRELLSLSKDDALVMHPLPAHRGWEIDSCTFEDYADEIFDEAENRLHVQKSVLVLCMKGKQ